MFLVVADVGLGDFPSSACVFTMGRSGESDEVEALDVVGSEVGGDFWGEIGAGAVDVADVGDEGLRWPKYEEYVGWCLAWPFR